MAIYNSGNITREAGKEIKAHRLVKLVDGKVEHAGAEDAPYGVVNEAAAPKGSPVVDYNFKPAFVRVDTDASISEVETDGSDIKDGADVYAAADGKVSSAGTVKVGKAHFDAKGNFVRVHLLGIADNS